MCGKKSLIIAEVIMTNNCTCKSCGREYHHCSSCGYDGEWYDQYEYCCESCAKKSLGHVDLKTKIVEFIESLTKEQRITFMDIIESDDDEVFDIINNDLMGRIGVEAWGYW